jgi:hypothetical protein
VRLVERIERLFGVRPRLDLGGVVLCGRCGADFDPGRVIRCRHGALTHRGCSNPSDCEVCGMHLGGHRLSHPCPTTPDPDRIEPDDREDGGWVISIR